MRDRLRRAVRENPRLTVLLLGAAVLFYAGIWRPWHPQLIPDEMGATTQPFLLFVDEPGLTKFEKGGNFHVWLLAVAYLPVLVVLGAYWLATGQLGMVLDAAYDLTAYTTGEQWTVADPRVLEAYYLFLTTGRLVSATAGLLTVLGVALLGRRLYGERAGLLAGATLSVSLGFVLTAKYATEDVVAACLVIWTFLLLARHYDVGTDRPLLAAAGLAGLSISAKATAGLLVVPVAVLAIRQYRPLERPGVLADRTVLRELALYPAAAIGAYVATTPSLLLYPGAYVDEILRYTAVRAGDAAYYASPDPGPVAHVGHLATALGGPLLLLAILATAGVVVLAATGRLHGFTWYLLGFAVPYFLLVSSWSNVQYNRALLLVPFLALFVGAFAGWATARERPNVRRVMGPIVAVVLVLSLVYTGTGAVAWSTSRADATDWTHANFDESTNVTTLAKPIYLPSFPATANVSRTAIDPLYDRNDEARKERAIARVRCHRSEFVVLTSFHYERYFEDPSVAPNRTALYEALLAEELGYRIVASFGPPNPNLRKDAAGRIERAFRLEPPSRNTNNPRIVVLERTVPSGQGAGCPTDGR